MKQSFATFLIASSALSTGAMASFDAKAQSEMSAMSAVSTMPLASVVVGASAVAGAVVAVPLVLSTAGSVLVIKAVDVTAKGSVCLLERASDGAQVRAWPYSRVAQRRPPWALAPWSP